MAKRRNNHQKTASGQARLSDMISNLPDNVIETILMHLPTRDAVRTSILSRKWRYSWAKLPQLILDETLWNDSIVTESARITVAMILYKLLLLHEGPINKFTLSIPGLKSCPEIDNLIFFLSRNGIEDLTLELWTDECYRLPLSFFTCQQLRHLSLCSCLIETTPAFKGFSRLITLKLSDVTISAKALGSLISTSPSLELFELDISSIIHDLEIDAPNLKTFIFRGIAESIIFRKVPLLASVLFEPNDFVEQLNFMEGGTYNFVEFFHGLPVLEKLHLDYFFAKSLAAGEVPTRLPTTLVYLKELKLVNIMLDESNELSFILCLIRSSPNLKHIYIKFSYYAVSSTNVSVEFMKEQDDSDVILTELKEVKLKNVTGRRSELELIKLLLAKSPSLEKMVIRHGEQTAFEEFTTLRELTKFRRASKEAEVIYVEI